MLDTYMNMTGKENIEEERIQAQFDLDRATRAVLDYTNRTVLIPELEHIVIELAVNWDDVKDRKGIKARSEGAISETYIEETTTHGIPISIASRLNNYRFLHIAKVKDK